MLAGASATGKTGVSYRLARYFDVGITEVDDLYIALQTLTTPEQQPELHYWQSNVEAPQMTTEAILDLHLSVARVMQPALKAVIANHLEEGTPIVLEGDYILPELLTRQDDTAAWDTNRVRAVFLYEEDQQQIVQNFLAREPDEGEQTGRAKVSHLYSTWLKRECSKHRQTALAARPWKNLLDRIVKAIT